MSYNEKPRWTKAQEEFLRNNYEILVDEEISVVLGRTLKSVRRKRERMELPKEPGRGFCMARVSDAKKEYNKLAVIEERESTLNPQ